MKRNIGLSFILIVGTGAECLFCEEPLREAKGADGIEKEITGWLSLDANSHFFSYGVDVWNDGGNASDFAFNPAFGLNFAITDKLSANIGSWWDVNNKGGNPLGEPLQEIDLWGGLAYDFGFVSVSATYQQWIYADTTEEIVDFGFVFDGLLSPSVTVHHRLDAGGSGGNEGTVITFGVEYGFEVGRVSLSIPLGVGLFVTDEFHGAGGDEGFGYFSAGLRASYPLSRFDSPLGKWNFNSGIIYYHANDNFTIHNPEEDFVVTKFGLGLSF